MAISLYQAVVPPAIRALTNLGAVLEKAAAHCEAKKIDPAVLVSARLFPDMFPLSRQVQVATDIAKAGASRLAGQAPPAYEDNEASIPDLLARVRRTIDFLQSLNPEQLDGPDDRVIRWKMRSGDKSMAAVPYVQSFVLPNLYFHVATAYNILRHNGVELGKADFLGPL